jgi:hypothetical protein
MLWALASAKNVVTTLTIPEPSVWAIAPGMFAPNRKTSAIITDLLRFNSLPSNLSSGISVTFLLHDTDSTG